MRMNEVIHPEFRPRNDRNCEGAGDPFGGPMFTTDQHAWVLHGGRMDFEFGSHDLETREGFMEEGEPAELWWRTRQVYSLHVSPDLMAKLRELVPERAPLGPDGKTGYSQRERIEQVN